MRSRFLTADYFAPSPSAASSSDLAIALASLPSLPSRSRLFLPIPTSSTHSPSPPISSPTRVWPARISTRSPSTPRSPNSSPPSSRSPLPVPDIPAADEGLLDDYLYGRGVYGNGFSSMDPVAFRIPKASEGLDDSHTKGDKEEGLSLEASAVTKRGGLLEAMFEVPEVDFLLDFIDIDTETRIPYPAELAESIYQVEVPVKHDDDMNCPYAKDSSCMEITGLENGQIIPQLEASMISWELDECPAKTAVSNIFHNIVEHLYDGAQVRLPSFGSTEFLRSCDMDIFALVCKDAPRVEYRADKPITAKDVAEMDFVRINHDILLDKKSALYPLKPDGTCSDFPCSILLEEVETINFPSEDAFKTLVQSVKAEMNTSEVIFKDDFDQAKSFYESVVSSEWALVDDTFKSLPTPILPDDKAMRSMLPPIEVLCSLKPLPLSAADGIYLDWHLLSEGPCNQESCSTYTSMVEEVKPCSLSPEMQISCQQMPALDISFLEDFPRSAKLQHEDKKNEIYVPGPIPHDPSANLETTQKNMLESDVRGHSHMDKLSPEKESSLFKSTSQSNGLSFYLNVRNDTNKVSKNEDISTLDIPSSKQAAPFSTRPRVNKLIEIHPVNLSDLIQGLIKDIHVSYTSALQESAYFRHSFSDGQGLSISKQKLLELITGEGSEGLYSYCKYEDKMELIVLYALKQVAYYLCFFGLHAAYLYVGNLTGTFENIPERLRNIQRCIGEARLKAEKQLLESHPSLSVIEIILRSNTQIG
ncbi:unnamed protein product [Miscanthus lutarioriparius]|uniref:Uncharacterized protein n=1 Tax=Miscanthus lutarioriparius TaxID=422564 RepID=A0A811PW38_9POAL|nr:unnamed protein product [Miscanthus lutarioriparius]